MTDEDDARKWAQAHMDNLRREIEGYECDDDYVKDWQVEMLNRKVEELVEDLKEVSSQFDRTRDTIRSDFDRLQEGVWLIGAALVVLLGLILWRIW